MHNLILEDSDPIATARHYIAGNAGDPAARAVIQGLLNYIVGLPTIRRLEYRVQARLDALAAGTLREEQP